MISKYIALSYNDITNKDILLFIINEPSLKNYVTKKEEKKKDKTFSRMPKIGQVDVSDYLFGVVNKNIENHNEISSNSNSNLSMISNQFKRCDVNEYNRIRTKSNMIQYTNSNLINTINPINTNTSNTSNTSSYIIHKDKQKQEKHDSHSDFLLKSSTLSDFQIIKLIGIGSFSKIYCIQHNLSKLIYALKVINKETLIEYDQIKNAILEKKILSEFDFPFLIKSNHSFQSKDKIFFVLPFLSGGDLFFHLKKKTFSEENVKLISSQIVLSLQYLHSNNIIYRDLKPENIMIDSDGFIKIIDFGLSKNILLCKKAFSLCGTPEYISPEVLLGKGYSILSDYWSLGVLIYELLIGIPPFYNQDISRMYELILFSEVSFPSNLTISKEAKDLIKALLVKDASKRLGSNMNDFKNNVFFKGLNFIEVMNKTIKPKFIPSNNKFVDIDLHNFDEEIIKLGEASIDNTQINILELIEKNNDLFKDF